MFYEVSPWHTVGGNSGNFELQTPWDTPAELVITQISATVAGIVIISFDGLGDLAQIAATPTTGTTTKGARGLVMRVGANVPVTFANDPVPVENRRVYVQTLTDSAGQIWLTAHWRRQAPEAGSYMHSDQSLAATAAMLGDQAKEQREAAISWSINTATDNTLASRQSFSQKYGSPLRRSNSSRPGHPTLLEKLTPRH